MYQSERLARIRETLSQVHHCLATDMPVGFTGLARARRTIAAQAKASGDHDFVGAVLQLELELGDQQMTCSQIAEVLGVVLAELAYLDGDEQPAALPRAV